MLADDPRQAVDRLQAAGNAHDLEAIVACFAPGYVNQTPVHPARGFRGNDQVRRNWAHILAAMPDLQVEVLATAVAGSTVWSEWEHRGTREDGSQHLVRGVVIFDVAEDLIAGARFYLEPVDTAAAGVDVAVRDQIVGRAREQAR